MSVLFVHSHAGSPGELVERAAATGDVVAVRERALTAGDLDAASGLITTTHLDQNGWLDFAVPVARLLNRGGRWIFNGHMLRPFLPGLGVYMPLLAPKRDDFVQTRLNAHPIFADIDQQALARNRGVAGFYGRGHNPLPPGGLPINGLGPARVPVDWAWAPPTGGVLISHAGNEFWGCGDDDDLKALLFHRAVAWAGGRL